MPRRGENIRKRKDGRWEARYIKNDDAVSKYGSVYGKTYREAKEKRDQIIRQERKPNTKTKAIIFKDILAAWQDANRVRLKASSVSRYQNLIDVHILPVLGAKRMDQLSTAAINQFLAEKLEKGRCDGTGGLSVSYVRSMALIISSAISYGAGERLCSRLNTPITKPSPLRNEMIVLTRDQQDILEKALLEDINEDKLFIYITLYTGLRIGEACALRWEDIDWRSTILYVRQTVSRVWFCENGKKYSSLIVGPPKTNSSLRYIPVCSKLYKVLKSYPHRREQGYILPNLRNGGFTSPRTFEYRYKKILKACGLDPVNYHALRHTFATRCIEQGVDIKSLSEVLGHANVSVTLNTYVHSSVELKRVQLEKLVS